MPIDNLSDRVRIPRLGKIHLGIKATSPKTGAEYPKATDYFVVPDEVEAVYGKTPRELDIMFPVEDLEQFAPQFLRAYSQTQGLVCIGDGIKARRKLDIETGKMASSKTENWTWSEMTCNAQECPEYSAKKCRRVLNLLFLLPKVSGLGAWQIDTSSYNSIININSMAKMLKGILGRCSMIPLTLVLKPQDVSPSGMKKKTVYVLDIKQDIKLADLAQMAQLPPSKMLLPEVTDEIPEDLYTTSQLGEEPPPEQDIPPGEEKTVTEEETVVDTSNLPPEDAKSASATRKKAAKGSKIATDEDKQVFVDKMQALGYTTEDAMRRDIERATGKKRDWTCDDFDKTLSFAQKLLALAKEATNLAAKLADDEDKQAFVIEMRELGYESKEAIKEAIKKATGKEREWTCGDFEKTLSLVKEHSPEKDQETEDFLETEKML